MNGGQRTIGAMHTYLSEMINNVLPMIINPLHILFCFAMIMAVVGLTSKLCDINHGKIAMNKTTKASAA